MCGRRHSNRFDSHPRGYFKRVSSTGNIEQNSIFKRDVILKVVILENLLNTNIIVKLTLLCTQ